MAETQTFHAFTSSTPSRIIVSTSCEASDDPISRQCTLDRQGSKYLLTFPYAREQRPTFQYSRVARPDAHLSCQ